ncbi:MAG: pyruvate oxidase, partial [Bifidobacterium crudilactis]|nr:pyruvate oxidase [Bifidobacterium crudilactis]
MSSTINAGDAVLKVIEEWGVPRIYGLPGGSFDSMMNALHNGLYDAREDRVPVLALVGQVPQAFMNMDFFQAMDEEPIFEDVAVFNRTATNAEGLPALIDEAIRQAYKHHGVSVITIP